MERDRESHEKPVCQRNTLGNPKSHGFISFLEIWTCLTHCFFPRNPHGFNFGDFFFSSDRKCVDLITINQNPSQHSTPGNYYQLTGIDERGKT